MVIIIASFVANAYPSLRLKRNVTRIMAMSTKSVRFTKIVKQR